LLAVALATVLGGPATAVAWQLCREKLMLSLPSDAAAALRAAEVA
jgi:hypothetical protein